MSSLMRLPDDAPGGPLVAHCDARRVSRLAPGLSTRLQILEKHCKNLGELAAGRPVWLPAFNYDFCRTGIFDVQRDPSQVGPITEFFRTSISNWRSTCPVFNFSGTGQQPQAEPLWKEEIDPFGADSLFGRLVAEDGVLVWFGAPMEATTIIHHAERVAGGPHYRYDKFFRGLVRESDLTEPRRVTLRYHVRPVGHHLDYDWGRLASDLRIDGLIHEIDRNAGIFWASAALLVTRWAERIAEDPLYLLDCKSRGWVDDKLAHLGRRFEQADFEQPAS